MYRICYFIFLISIIPSFAQQNPDLRPFEHTNQKYGYQDQNGRIVIEPQYEQALPFAGVFAYAKNNGLWGLITTKGKWAIPAIYEQIGWTNAKNASPAVSGDVTAYKQNGKWGLISVKNKEITPPAYDVLLYFAEGLVEAGRISTESGQTDTLFGIINTKGKEVIPLQYHTLVPTQEANVWLAGRNKIYTEAGPLQMYGLLSSSNQVLLPVQYKQIIQPESDKFTITSFRTYHSLTPKGDTLASFMADSLYEVAENVYAFASGNQFGVVSGMEGMMVADKEQVQPQQHGFIPFKSKGKYGLLTIIKNEPRPFLPPQYDSVVILSHSLIKAGIRESSRWNWELIANTGTGERVASSQVYQFIDEVKEGHPIRVMKEKLYGFITATGEEFIPLKYDSLSNFTDSLCVAFAEGKAGILKTDGSWHIQPAADWWQIGPQGYFIRKEKGQWELLDTQGRRKHISTAPLRFLPDGSIEIFQKGKYGRLSPSGIPAVPALYDSIAIMSTEQTFWAYLGKNILLYTNQGELLVKEGIIESIHYTPGEFSAVKTGGKYGFVDEKGRLRISNRYEAAKPFSEGLAAVKLAGKWGFVNKGDKIAVQPYYDEVSPLQNGFIIARKGKKYGLLDKTGRETTGFTYDHIMRHRTGYFITTKGDKQGLLGKNGVETIYIKYSAVQPQPDGHVIVEIQGKNGLLTDRGVTLLPAVYEQFRYNAFSRSYLLQQAGYTREMNTGNIIK